MELDKVRLGMDAESVLNSDAMKKVAKDIRDMLIKDLENAPLNEEGERKSRELRAQAQGMADIRTRLKRLRDEGSAERRQQQALEAATQEKSA